MGQLALKPDEVTCVETCVTKNVHANQRLMSIYVEVNPDFQEKKMKEQQAELAANAAAVAAAANQNNSSTTPTSTSSNSVTTPS